LNRSRAPNWILRERMYYRTQILNYL